MLRCRLGWFAVVVVAFSKSGDVFIFFFYLALFTLFRHCLLFCFACFSLSLNCFFLLLLFCFSSIFLSSLVLLHCWLSWPHAPHVGCSVFFLFHCCLRMCGRKRKLQQQETSWQLHRPSFFFPLSGVSMYFQSNPKIRRGKKKNVSSITCAFCLFFFFFEFNKAYSIVAGRQIKHIYRLHC